MWSRYSVIPMYLFSGNRYDLSYFEEEVLNKVLLSYYLKCEHGVADSFLWLTSRLHVRFLIKKYTTLVYFVSTNVLW